MAQPDEKPDELADPPASRTVTPTVAAALVLLLAVVLLSVAGHGGKHRPRAAPSPTPIVLPTPVAVHHRDHGAVFLEHLSGCTQVKDSRLTVALGVTNLSQRSLRLVRAVPLNADLALDFDGARVGAPPCAANGRHQSVMVRPSQEVVVELTFDAGNRCPQPTALAARVMFIVGGHVIVHADSSQLADLSQVRFVGCT